MTRKKGIKAPEQAPLQDLPLPAEQDVAGGNAVGKYNSTLEMIGKILQTRDETQKGIANNMRG